MSKDAVLTLFEEMKARVFGISDLKKEDANDPFIFSLLPVGFPIRHEDFANPWTPSSAPGGDAQARQRSLYNLSQLVNVKLAMDGSGRVVQGAGSLQDTWELILTSAARKKDLPEPDPKAKKRVLDAQKKLYDGSGVKTPLYDRYQRYKRAMFMAETRYASAYREAMRNPESANAWPVEGKVFLDEYQTARDEFYAIGKKEEVEAALDTITAQGRDAVEAVIAMADRNFRPWQLTLGTIAGTTPYVQVLPSDWSNGGSNDGWTQYRFTSRDVRSTHSDSTTRWGGSAGVSFGFWRFGASAGGQTTTVDESFSEDDLEIEFSYAAAQIQREWLETILLSVEGWMLVGQKAGVISDGTSKQVAGPNAGFWLPAVPTQMLLVKNVRIRTKNSASTYESLRKHVQAGGGFGWGFFSIGGSYRRDSFQSKSTFHFEDGWIVVDGVQLVGWVSEIMPRSPSESGL
jgi:hypothetical protein